MELLSWQITWFLGWEANCNSWSPLSENKRWWSGICPFSDFVRPLKIWRGSPKQSRACKGSCLHSSLDARVEGQRLTSRVPPPEFKASFKLLGWQTQVQESVGNQSSDAWAITGEVMTVNPGTAVNSGIVRVFLMTKSLSFSFLSCFSSWWRDDLNLELQLSTSGKTFLR